MGEGPWCYTADPNVRWDYCEVPQCGKSCYCLNICQLFVGMCCRIVGYSSLSSSSSSSRTYIFTLQRFVNRMKAMDFVMALKAMEMATGPFMWTEAHLNGDHSD